MYYELSGYTKTNMGEVMVDLLIHHYSTSSYALMSVLSPTVLKMGVLQVNSHTCSVAYFFWVPLLTNLEAAIDFNQEQGFEIFSTSNSRESCVCLYRSSFSFSPLPPEETLRIPEYVIPRRCTRCHLDTCSWTGLVQRG